MITRDDINAIKLADDWHFHTYQGRSWIVVGLRAHTERLETPRNGREFYDARVYTAREQVLYPDVDRYSHGRSRDITADSARLAHYGERTRGDDWQGFASMYTSGERHTVANNLKVGDSLQFEWTASNNSQVNEQNGTHTDMFRLLVFRPGKDGVPRQVGTYLLVVQTGPDNSARMVKG